tara:strand:+ start:534 stop:677 length:144 start_codon:yes stop_codon:yes gene_type:complete
VAVTEVQGMCPLTDEDPDPTEICERGQGEVDINSLSHFAIMRDHEHV